MKIVFLGSSELSVIPLKKLIDAGHEISAVVCQPDKPNARGKKIEVSSLKKYSISQNIPIYQFKKIRDEGVNPLKELKPDLLVIVYYGQILSQEIIDIGKFGIINLHPSLLPKYRGPSPVITPILNGDIETGVTIMRVEKNIDSGNILTQKKVEIYKNETAGELWERLTKLGSELLIEAINKISNNSLVEQKQIHSQATYTRMFDKKDAKINFNKSADEIVNHVRAFNPNPVAYFDYKNEKYKVYEVEKIESTSNLDAKQNGEILTSSLKDGLQIKAGEDIISITRIQAPNGKVLEIKNFLNGKKLDVGYVVNK